MIFPVFSQISQRFRGLCSEESRHWRPDLPWGTARTRPALKGTGQLGKCVVWTSWDIPMGYTNNH